MQIVVTIFHLIFSISLIVIVLLQSGKQAGLSGSIAGGAETFFGKNKGRTIDAILGKYTAVAAIGFLITSVILQLIISK
ncbi:preprotein translocase subunit SecG [Acetivibrio straminisolvens]|uniref:preprotein translocase subunit SecG n=1 Tax=Acetivibrio straminisolvens TaxID=253314 RepID=UPI00056F4D7E|nr:preprotein translocase subunit SecG [Acetivibrio straminisolvens]